LILLGGFGFLAVKFFSPASPKKAPAFFVPISTAHLRPPPLKDRTAKGAKNAKILNRNLPQILKVIFLTWRSWLLGGYIF